jgi:hypothetical protein
LSCCSFIWPRPGHKPLTHRRGNPPGSQHVAEIADVASERAELAIAPPDDIRDIEMVVADLNPDIDTFRKRRDPPQQFLSHHRESILS